MRIQETILLPHTQNVCSVVVDYASNKTGLSNNRKINYLIEYDTSNIKRHMDKCVTILHLRKESKNAKQNADIFNKDTLHNKIVGWVIGEELPFKFVESKLFKSVLKAANPHVDSIMALNLKEYYADLKILIMNEISINRSKLLTCGLMLQTMFGN